MTQSLEIARPLPRTVPAAGGFLPPALVQRLAALRAWAAARPETLTVCGVLGVALLHFLRVYDRGLNLLDEGFVLHVSERVMQGQVPYRDFFIQLTPGTFVALALVFKVAGPSILVGRWVTVVLGLAITLLLYRGGRRLVSRPTAALAALAFPIWGMGQGWFYPNYSWFALACGAAALLALLRAFEAHDPATYRRAPFWLPTFSIRWYVAAGMLCGLEAFFKQNMGLYTLVTLGAATLAAAPGGCRSRLQGAVLLAVASAPIPLALLVWLWSHGALADFYRDAVWIPLTVFPSHMAAPYPTFWPPWPLATDRPGHGEWAFRLVCALPPLPFALTAVRLAVHAVRRRPVSQQTAALVAWLAFGLAMWVTAFPRADFDHIQVALGPVFVLGAAAFEAIGRGLVQVRAWRLWGGAGATWCRRSLPQVVACALLGGFLVAGVGNARLLHMGPDWTLRGIGAVAPRAAGLRLDHDDAAELSYLIAEVRRLSPPNARIAALPWNAGLYFLAERANVTRFDLFIPASVLPDDMPEIERALASADLIVYWTPRDPFVNNTSFDDRYPELHAFLMARFRAVSAVNAYRLLLPAPPFSASSPADQL